MKHMTPRVLGRTLYSLLRDRSGSISVYVAISMMTLISAAGLYTDLSNTTRIRNEYQVALDNALVVAARKEDTADREQRAAEMFKLSLSDSARAALGSGGARITTSPNGKFLVGEVVGGVDQNFRFIFGQPTVNVTAASKVAIASAQRRQGDFVFVIDATGSMGSTIAAVKANATTFQANFNQYLVDNEMDPLEGMRIRVVFFQDYYSEGNAPYASWGMCGTSPLAASPMNASRFFSVDIPSEQTAFLDFVSGQLACNGGDAAEYGLEGINEAMNSPWARPGDVLAGPAFYGTGPSDTNTVEAVYPIIVLWTDIWSYPLPPDPRVLPPNSFLYPYPSSSVMPYSYADYNAKWSNPSVINQANKLLITFVNNYSLDNSTSDSYNGQNGYFYTIKNWASHERGGTLTEGNTNMVKLIAKAVMKKMMMPSIVQ